MNKLLKCLFLWMIVTEPSFAFQREIALTIDDLPFVGEYKNIHLDKIINLIQEYKIPATGFVIAGKVQQNNWPLLYKFREAGFGVGNHTLSHISLDKVDSETYIQEIEEADKILAPVLTEPKYFRYPYLAMGKEEKKEQILDYLASKNYHIAPITIDSKDFMFNQKLLSVPQEERRGYLEELKLDYLDFIWQQTLIAEQHNRLNHRPEQAQILLIHANILNAYVLQDIIHLYQDNGYKFVSLEKALQTFKKRQQRKKIAKQENKLNIEEWVDEYFAWD